MSGIGMALDGAQVSRWARRAIWASNRRTTRTCRYGNWNATILAAAAYLVAVGVVEFALPAVDETPAGSPAAVLYEFWMAALGTQLVLWATLGLLFGWLTERSMQHGRLVAAPTAS